MLPRAAVCAAPDPFRSVTGFRENFMVFPPPLWTVALCQPIQRRTPAWRHARRLPVFGAV